VSYLFVLALLGTLILIHELGHLCAARLAGIPVVRFSVGFGPTLVERSIGAMQVRLALFPLGGYVLPEEDALRERSLARRVGFYLGGPLANILLALPLFAALEILAHGVSLDALVVAPFVRLGATLAALGLGLSQLFGQPEALSGVLGIVVEGGRYVETGALQALQLAIALTLNLAVINLLPIPILDGGKVVLHVLESLVPRAVALEVPLAIGGLLLIVAALGYATYLDLARLLA